MQAAHQTPREFDNGGGPPDDGSLASRVGRLEVGAVEIRERLARIEARLEQTATKEDLANATAMLVKWMVGLFVGFTTMNIVVMTFVLNYAAPPQGRFARPLPEAASAALAADAGNAPPPIVIVIPPSALQWQAPPQK